MLSGTFCTFVSAKDTVVLLPGKKGLFFTMANGILCCWPPINLMQIVNIYMYIYIYGHFCQDNLFFTVVSWISFSSSSPTSFVQSLAKTPISINLRQVCRFIVHQLYFYGTCFMFESSISRQLTEARQNKNISTILSTLQLK